MILRVISFLFALSAITIGLLLQKATENLPWVTEAEILADGGKVFKYSKDGPLLEYFDWGDPNGELILAIHGFTTDGKLFEPLHEFFLQNHFRVIAPSIPGWGFSSADVLLNLTQFAEVMNSLMHHVAPNSDFSVTGVSMGGPHAAAVASIFHERVINVNLVVPFGVSDGINDPVKDTPWELKTLLWITSLPFVNDMLSYYFLVPWIQENFSKFLSVAAATDFEATVFREKITEYDKYYQRSISRTRLGHRRMMAMLIYEQSTFNLKEIGNVKGNIFVTYGEKDGMVSKNNPIYYHDQIPRSVLVSRPLSHMDMVVELPEFFLQMMGK